MIFFPKHKHHAYEQETFTVTAIQWCECGDHRARATLIADADWTPWRKQESWMILSPRNRNEAT